MSLPYVNRISFQVRDMRGVWPGHAHVECFPQMSGRKVTNIIVYVSFVRQDFQPIVCIFESLQTFDPNKIKTRTPNGKHVATQLDIQRGCNTIRSVQATVKQWERTNREIQRRARMAERAAAVQRGIMRSQAVSSDNIGSGASAVQSGHMRVSAVTSDNVRSGVSEGTVRDLAITRGTVRHIPITDVTDEAPDESLVSPMVPACKRRLHTLSPMVPTGATKPEQQHIPSPMVPAGATQLDQQHTPPPKKRMRPYINLTVPETPPQVVPRRLPDAGDPVVRQLIPETPSPQSEIPVDKLLAQTCPVQDQRPETTKVVSPCGKKLVFTTNWGLDRRVVKVSTDKFWTQAFPNYVSAGNMKGGVPLPKGTADIFRKAVNTVLPRHMHVCECVSLRLYE